MKIAYAICSLLVLTVVGLVFLGSGTSFAGHDCPCPFGIDFCGWHTQPIATDANAKGEFDTATDGDPNEPTIDWCIPVYPIGAGVFFIEPSSPNIDFVTYTPSTFSAHCQGSQQIGISGELDIDTSDGTVVTRVIFGTLMCQADYSLAIDAD